MDSEGSDPGQSPGPPKLLAAWDLGTPLQTHFTSRSWTVLGGHRPGLDLVLSHSPWCVWWCTCTGTHVHTRMHTCAHVPGGPASHQSSALPPHTGAHGKLPPLRPQELKGPHSWCCPFLWASETSCKQRMVPEAQDGQLGVGACHHVETPTSALVPGQGWSPLAGVRFLPLTQCLLQGTHYTSDP